MHLEWRKNGAMLTSLVKQMARTRVCACIRREEGEWQHGSGIPAAISLGRPHFYVGEINLIVQYRNYGANFVLPQFSSLLRPCFSWLRRSSEAVGTHFRFLGTLPERKFGRAARHWTTSWRDKQRRGQRGLCLLHWRHFFTVIQNIFHLPFLRRI